MYIFGLTLYVFLFFAPDKITYAEDPFTLTGYFVVIWGDGKPGTDPESPIIYMLAQDDGPTVELAISDEVLGAVGGKVALNRRHVTVEVVSPSRASNGEPLNVLSITIDDIERAIEKPSALTGSQPFVTIRCSFSDSPGVVGYATANYTYFQGMYGGTYPGLDHYWRELSYDLINMAGSATFPAGATTWYTLPGTQASYVSDPWNGSNPDLTQLFTDCVAAADPFVDFSNYDGINLMFDGRLGCCAWGGGRYATIDGVNKFWPATWEPPWGWGNISVMGHEIGHSFGFPHSDNGDGDTNTYDNPWDVMSDPGGLSDATYGNVGQHTNPYHKGDITAWLPGKYTTVANGTQATITLDRLAQPTTSNDLGIKVPIGATGRFYTVEARGLVGYDAGLPSAGVVIYEVNTSRASDAWLVPNPSHSNPNTTGGYWAVGEVYNDAGNNITISVVAVVGNGFTVLVNNNATVTSCSGDVVVIPPPATFMSGSIYNCEATISITVGPGVTIQSGATVNLTAPIITLQPGVTIESGAVVNMKQ